MRRFFRWVLKVLILIVAGLISFSLAMRFAIHGREVMVPSFIGMAPGQAEQVATQNGLLLSREERFYSSEVPIGRIMSQEPPARTKVRRGWRVRVAESLGPQKVTIPNVVGDSERAAELNIQRRGLEVGAVSMISTTELPADQVVAQSPPAEAQGVTSPKVSLLFNAPVATVKSYVMPDFVGARLAEATVAVTDAGLKIGNVRTLTAEAQAPAATPKNGAKKPPAEAVISAQNPAAGSRVETGATVNFDVVRR